MLTRKFHLVEQNKVMTIIRDKHLCLTVEVKDNEGDYGCSVEVLGLATYSNSESTMYASIFEILWLAELNNKKKNIYQLSLSKRTKLYISVCPHYYYLLAADFDIRFKESLLHHDLSF